MGAIKKYVVLSLLCISSVAYGMKRAYSEDDKPKYDAKVQTYFAPGDRKAMKDDLFSLIDNATQSIYIAMYLITDDSLIDKLIAAKKRNVIVELYLDGSSSDIIGPIIEKFLQNDITPIVFPSQANGTGIMHDKFFIIDLATVVTGSANFTRPAFDDTLQKFNYENIVIIHSYEVASQFLKDVVRIQVGTFNLYIDMIADYESKDLPAWFHKLFPILFKQGGRLVQTFWKRMNEMNDLQRDRVNKWRTEKLKV
jgi:phosphatidylserine/phosphatidylglycerophosphate/cardiolipin synthase-like enzyme